jgi:hypothetical protein
MPYGDGHIKTTTGQFVAVANVSGEIKLGVANTTFNFPGAMADLGLPRGTRPGQWKISL